MTFKSATQPFCRSCGKPLRKDTTTVNVELKPTEYHRASSGWRYVYGVLRDLDDCRRHSNQLVLRVEYDEVWTGNLPGDGDKRRGPVRRFFEWDGESYVNEFFCSNTCAQDLGRVCAREGKCLQAYNDAIHKAREKEKANG